MKPLLGVIAGLVLAFSHLGAAEPPAKSLVTGLKSPEAVAVGADHRIYVTDAGQVLAIVDGKAVPFATGLTQPKGMVAFHEFLFVADGKRVCRIDKTGKVKDLAVEKAFPNPISSLGGIAVDEVGTVYVADSGDGKGSGAALYRIDFRGKVTLVVDAQKEPALKRPAALTMDGMSFVLLVDSISGTLSRLNVANGTMAKVADGFGAASGIAWDHYGRLFLGDSNSGKIWVIGRPGDKAVQFVAGFEAPAGLGLDPAGKNLLVVDRKTGTLTALPARDPSREVDETPLELESAVAFPDLQWTGWKPETASGKPNPLRPIVLTHAGDGSDRVFVATEQGVIHVFPNDQKATETRVFLDMSDRVVYNNMQNEEGFLGLAFHPKYKTNGEFFVFYTTKKAKLTNIISRFKVSKDDPNKADPASEEILLKIEKPYWNHDGGTLCFGPDGYLYLTHGDGGLGNDPHKNGQNLNTLLGKVLRIDVDRKDAGKNYAVPQDNPFVEKKEAAPEIWAYGLRNIWRMSFDRKTGTLWAGDVGQNLYEEVDLIVKGGNYGWSIREGLHPFSDIGSPERKDLIDPIWEYDHDTGKCVIGGHVYRGPRLPELDGMYLYGDYVAGKLWALRYDTDKGRVVANRPIKDRALPMLSYGEDEKGEVYFLIETPTGKGIQWFVRTKGLKQ